MKNLSDGISADFRHSFLRVINEEETSYQKFFDAALKKFGVNSPDELKTSDRKKFFTYIDDNWTSKDEKESGSGSGRKSRGGDYPESTSTAILKEETLYRVVDRHPTVESLDRTLGVFKNKTSASNFMESVVNTEKAKSPIMESVTNGHVIDRLTNLALSTNAIANDLTRRYTSNDFLTEGTEVLVGFERYPAKIVHMGSARPYVKHGMQTQYLVKFGNGSTAYTLAETIQLKKKNRLTEDSDPISAAKSQGVKYTSTKKVDDGIIFLNGTKEVAVWADEKLSVLEEAIQDLLDLKMVFVSAGFDCFAVNNFKMEVYATLERVQDRLKRTGFRLIKSNPDEDEYMYRKGESDVWLTDKGDAVCVVIEPHLSDSDVVVEHKIRPRRN